MAPGTIPRDTEVDEVAPLVAYLASDDAVIITRSAHVVDGGMPQH